MPSQGPLDPTTFSNVDADGPDWTNPSNAASSDDSRADVSMGPSTNFNSNLLKAKGFGFSLPSGATIDGIVVEVERHVQGGLVGGCDYVLYIVQDDNDFTGDDKAVGTGWPTSDAYATYGGATDKWGLTWTAAQINSANFGFEIAALNPNADIEFESFFIDHIRITVYYTPASGAPLMMMIGVGA